LLHPRTTQARADLAFPIVSIRYDFLQNLKDLIPKSRRRVNVLQLPQQLRNVVARARIEFDRTDIDFVQHQLRIQHFSHGSLASNNFRKLNVPAESAKLKNCRENRRRQGPALPENYSAFRKSSPAIFCKNLGFSCVSRISGQPLDNIRVRRKPLSTERRA